MVKNILTILIVCCLPVLFSCTKNGLSSSDENNDLHCLVAYFEASGSMKTVLSEHNAPKWCKGDKIWLSTGDPKTATFGTVTSVSETDGTASISTSLDFGDGTVYAVYPYTADCNYSVDATGEILFDIPSEQSGTFAEANICVSIGNKQKGLKFRNATSIIKIEDRTRSVGMVLLEKRGICGQYQIDYATLRLREAGCSDKITVKLDDNAQGPFFIAVAFGIEYKSGETVAEYCKRDGTLLKERKVTSDVTFKRSKIYNLGNTYSTIDGGLE